MMNTLFNSNNLIKNWFKVIKTPSSRIILLNINQWLLPRKKKKRASFWRAWALQSGWGDSNREVLQKLCLTSIPRELETDSMIFASISVEGPKIAWKCANFAISRLLAGVKSGVKNVPVMILTSESGQQRCCCCCCCQEKGKVESFFLAATTDNCPGQHFPIISLHPFSLHKRTLSCSSRPYQPQSRNPAVQVCCFQAQACPRAPSVPCATSSELYLLTTLGNVPENILCLLCLHNLLPQDPQRSFEWSRAVTRAHLPDQWKILLLPCQAQRNHPCHPQPVHSAHPWAWNLSGEQGDGWSHPSSVAPTWSLTVFTAVQMPGSLSAQQNQQKHAQNQLSPQHVSVPCNTSVPQSKETLIPFGNELPGFSLDLPTHTCWLHQPCANSEFLYQRSCWTARLYLISSH